LLKTQSPPTSTKLSIAAALGNCEQFGEIDPKAWHIEGPVIRARRSEIYRASHPNIQPILCVKYSKAGERNAKSLKQEYSNLQKFSKAMVETNFKVPRPVVCLPDANILVLEWVNGKSVKFELNRTFRKYTSRQILLKKAAHWLKEFHLKGGIKSEIFDPQTLANQINLYRVNNPISFPSVDITVKKACETYYRETEQTAATKELFSFAHRDFTPGNIIVCDDAVMGIDMTKNTRRPVVEDLTRFLVDLNVNKNILNVGAQLLIPALRGWLQQDERTILTYYLGDKAEEMNKPIVLFLLMHTSKKMMQAADIVSIHRQTIGFKSPFLLLYRYIRYWKRLMMLRVLYKRLK